MEKQLANIEATSYNIKRNQQKRSRNKLLTRIRIRKQKMIDTKTCLLIKGTKRSKSEFRQTSIKMANEHFVIFKNLGETEWLTQMLDLMVEENPGLLDGPVRVEPEDGAETAELDDENYGENNNEEEV